MSRYIDADKLVQDLDDFYANVDFSWQRGRDMGLGINIARQIIDKQPTADVQEVKHETWEVAKTSISRAMAIFEDIESENYTIQEKAVAIYQVMRMPTHMSITKANMVKAMKWLWNENFELLKE